MRSVSIAFAISLLCAIASAQEPDGAALFASRCASCHNGAPENRAPSPETLRQRSPESILSALTAGGMRPQGGRMSGAERRAVAEYAAGRALSSTPPNTTAGRCTTTPPFSPSASQPAWLGWSPTTQQQRAQSTAHARLTADQVPKLTLRWAFGLPDTTSAWSQPTFIGGRLFLGGQNGSVYALDARSGCTVWSYTTKSGVRTAPVLGPRAGGAWTVYVGDTGANVYALDAHDGTLLWSRQVDDHPFARVTGSPTLHNDRLYVPVSSIEETAASQPGYECCTFRGSITALDTRNGAVAWKTYTVPPATVVGTNAAGTKLWAPSGVGIWSAPTVDDKRGVIYVATGNTYSGKAAEPTTDAILALNPATGAIKWTKQVTAGDVFGCRAGSANCLDRAGPDFDFGTPVSIAPLPGGRDLLVVGQKSGIAYALDPDKEGAIVWEYRAGQGSIWGGIQWGIAVDSDRVYLPVSDIRTPKPGGLHAVSLATGERLWYQPPPPLACQAGPNCNAALISAPTLIPGVVFAGSNDGTLRAHATSDGSIVWEFDTNREFMTVNGIRATGGSIQGAGPTIVDGMLFVNAGYGDHMGRAGNVLLAFQVQ